LKLFEEDVGFVVFEVSELENPKEGLKPSIVFVGQIGLRVSELENPKEGLKP